LPVLLGSLEITVDGRILLITETPYVISVIGVGGVRGGSRLHYRLGVKDGARAISTAKSNGSAKGDKRSRTDPVLPLKVEALVGRETLF
jgi:hypothetical protein